MVRTLISTVAAFVIALTSFTVVNGQTGPTDKNPGNPPTQPTAPGATTLSDADLLIFLKQLDPNVTTTRLKDGGAEYRLTLKADGWAYTLRIEAFADVLWIDAELGGRIADMTRVPSNLLADLLHANVKVGPTHFALMKNDAGYQLNACRMVTRTITVKALRGELDQFCKDVRDTYPQWNAVLTAVK